jgi:CubicO group peptidase (beta-lactamase class C family)
MDNLQTTTTVHGLCQDRFSAVRAAFSANFEQGHEVGASVAVTLDGELVVDLWGGLADLATGEPWKADTIVPTASSTKTVTALAALLLADRGELDLDAPVIRYWPEFAAAGKGGVLVRHCLGHTAGLPGWDEPLVFEDLYDWDKVTSLLARQAPWWAPGTASAYHAHTMGFLVGEVVRRITGQTIGAFFAEQIADPLGADYHIGLKPENDYRIGRMVVATATPGPPPPPGSIAARIAGNPPSNFSEMKWDERFLRAEIPGGNGHGNARSLAQIQAVLACAGEVAGRRLMSAQGCEAVLRQQSDGMDLGFLQPVKWGLGFARELGTNAYGSRACFWGGAGGSMIVVDLERRMTFAYVMNRMISTPFGDLRSAPLLAQTYAALGAASD